MNSRQLKRFLSRTIVSIAAALLLSSPASRAQDKDTLWTLVTARGSNIAVTWDKRHPWDQQLSTQSADLVAEYQTKTKGWVREILGHATSRNDRTYRYTLPDAVKSEPFGDICLYVQPVWSKGLLPIRSETQKGHDTARFRYEAWERVIQARAAARAAQERIASTEREIKASDQSIAAQEATLAERGWTSTPACQSITVVQTQDEPQPYDVVPVARHDEMARRVCIRRVWYGRYLLDDNLEGLKQALEEGKLNPQAAVSRLRTLFQLDYLVPYLAKLILSGDLKPPAGDPTGDFDKRQAQAREFLQDWDKLAASSPDYQPHLGTATDYLTLVTSSEDIAFRLHGAQLAKAIGAENALPALGKVTYPELLGLIGSALDAYFGCLEDGRKQLNTKFVSWQALQASAPARDRQKRDFLVRECTQAIGKLDEMKAARSGLQAQLERDKQDAANSPSTPLTARPQVLNAISCTQP